MAYSLEQHYMARALQLARCGEGRVAPNPMVGAVIVANDRIIGEGYHSTYGGPHAEVNAINSVREKDRKFLREATIYVTLEPCAHYGKTPPCVSLIIQTGIPRVVTGSDDPNPLVAGKGLQMLRDAGIKVISGILKEECDDLNIRFMTFHRFHRPFVQLKWAQSADGFMARYDEEGNLKPVKFSNPISEVLMHRERARSQAIMVGKNTLKIDSPRLDVRLWSGRNPERIDSSHHIDLNELMTDLYSRKIMSLMVEGGAALLKSFIDLDLYDEIRIETAPLALGRGLKAPMLPEGLKRVKLSKVDHNMIITLRR